MRTLYLLIGNIGSGKSTWAKEFIRENPNTKIVCADNFRVMFNGEYKYEEGLDDVIDLCMITTMNVLLDNGYDVIIDVCNMTEQRRETWNCFRLRSFSEIRVVAVTFPSKDKGWHVCNRLKNNHKDGTDWGKIYDGNVNAFEPIDESQYDEIIWVEEW